MPGHSQGWAVVTAATTGLEVTTRSRFCVSAVSGSGLFGNLDPRLLGARPGEIGLSVIDGFYTPS